MPSQDRKRKQWFIGWFLAVGAGIVLLWPYAFAAQGELTVHFFDVGQGDAIFIEMPRNFQILIDGGPDATVLERLSKVMPWWDRSLDLVVLTHPDADHVAGLIDVLTQYEVASVLESGIRKETKLSQEWERALAEEGAEIIIADQPKRIELADGAALDAVWPQESLVGKVMDEPNEYSVVTRLDYGKTSFLFTGDIERWAEQRLLATAVDLDVDVLKIPHHGSKTSSSEAFLTAVSPQIAVISVGEKNRYGHPAKSVLERLAERNIKVFRTDKDGTVIITGDGELLRSW